MCVHTRKQEFRKNLPLVPLVSVADLSAGHPVVSARAVVRDAVDKALAAAREPTLSNVMVRKVSNDAAMFESRWTMRALKRVDHDLCEAVEEQQSLFYEAIMLGDDPQIKEHGEAMCRGWSAAVLRMEQAKEPDDSYVVGICSTTGLKVAVGVQRAAIARVREIHGERVVWLHPDEVAAMFVGLQSVAAVKGLWPGAEITRVVERYPDEPAQFDE